MKYRLVDYKIEENNINKLILDDIQIIYDDAVETLDKNKFQSKLNIIINKAIGSVINNQYKLFIYINFRYKNITFSQSIVYNIKTNLFYGKISNTPLQDYLINKYNLQDELKNIKEKLKVINLQGLIDFLLKYNED